MGFAVHPAPPSPPLRVRAMTVGPLVEMAEHVSVDPATGRLLMIVRLVQVRDGEGAASTPSLRVAGGDGPPVVVGTNTPIPAGGPPAALATHTVEADDVHVVEIEVLQPNGRWHIQIENTDTVDHRYTWVVGDTDQATRRPWLDVPVPTLTFGALVGEAAPAQDLLLANYGPGPLTVGDPDGVDLGAGFRLIAVVPRTIGGNRRAVASIAFTAPDTPGSPSTTYAFASSDPAAGPAVGHANRVTLTAIVRPAWTVRGEVRRSDIVDRAGNRAYELDTNYTPLFVDAALRRPGSVMFSVRVPQFVASLDVEKAIGVWIKVNGVERIDLRLGNWLLPAPTWRQVGPIPLGPGPVELEISSGEGDGAGWPESTEPVVVGDVDVTLDP